MSTDWDRDIGLFASREGLTDDQTDAIQRFVNAMMRLDSVEVSIDSVTWSDQTTQMMTGATEADTEELELPLPEKVERRYLDLGRIGIGGMGEVRRVRDVVLNRFVAMKVLREEFATKRPAVMRFIAEAQATAQLQHPGMVPVHDIGQLPDGRWFFTMKELKGDTLETVMQAYRAGQTTRGLRGIVELVARVCDAVAFAHANGAIHRDLKPANILVGAYGEVVVLDWGLVKATGTPTGTPGLVTDLTTVGTKLGTVIGTPAYMPPEQAQGLHDQVGPPTDVYAIGAILYEILSGRRPYVASSSAEVLDLILTSNPEPLPSTVPGGLAAICRQAMRRDPRKRYTDAGLLGEELRAWMDGAARRERALQQLEEADRLQPEVESLLRKADRLAEEAEMLLAPIPSWAPTETKLEGWALEDSSVEERIRADLVGLERLQLLRAVLTELPEMPEAQERLAYVYHFCHQRAERMGDVREMAQYELLLRAHDRGTYADYLEGTGALSLVTWPRKATVRLYRFDTEQRRRVPKLVRTLPDTPLRSLPLGHGSWLLEVDAEGRRTTRVPVHIDRGTHWHGIPPGGKAPLALPLPWASDLAEDECYVPAGWCKVGDAPVRDAWVDGFFMKRFPVTNGQFLAFLNDLVDRGDEAAALRAQPATEGGPCFGRAPNGHFSLRNPRTNTVWRESWPVVYVDYEAAEAYSTWYGARTGQAWRLPWEDEWEKSARGVDGRRFVMGDFLDPSWAEIRGCTPTETVHPIDRFPLDESVYGVRGLTGGVADWCQDRHRSAALEVLGGRVERVRSKDQEPTVCRGGMRTVPAEFSTASFRHVLPRTKRSVRVGFRLVRSLEVDPDPETSGVWILR